jgi:predicted nucleotidyltransferase
MALTQQREAQVQQVLTELANQMRSLLRDNLLEIRLYGSWARQRAHLHSDIDLAVIVQELNVETWRQVHQLATKISLKHDLLLSVNLLSHQEWQDLLRLRTLLALHLQEESVLL